MPAIKLASFDGLHPRVSPTMLGENQATIAQDVKLYSGEIRNWRGPTLVFAPANGAAILTMYKIYNSAGLSTWLTWAGYVDVTIGPLADVSEVRLYYTDGASPRKTNYSMATGGSTPYPSAYLNMGVPTPTVAPTVGITGGTNTTAEARAYVYTYISTFGSVKEESAPSPPSALTTVGVSQAATISGFGVAGTTAAHYNITSLRIYRTFAGGTTGSGYAFVDEIAITPSTGVVVASGTSTGGVTYSGSTYADNLNATQIGEALATTAWAPPPAGLTGIVSMANGFLAGFVGNTVYFSEPFFPHSWPLAYTQTVNANIVGLGVFGSTLIVCTDKFPYAFSGATPDGMSQEIMTLPEPCVSKRSITSDDSGVTYASPNGLVVIGPMSRSVKTQALFRRDEWQVYTPTTMFAAVYDNQYFGFYNSTTLGQQVMSLNASDTPAMAIKNLAATAAYVDTKNGYLYYASAADNKLYQMDADATNPITFTWQSKRMLLAKGDTWSAIKVDADYTTNGTVNITIYGDGGTRVATLPITSYDPVRLPPFRCREMQVLIKGTINVRSVTIASTVEELHE